MAKKGNLPPAINDAMDEAPKKFQRMMQQQKQQKEKPVAPKVEHPWKIQAGESYAQFEQRLSGHQKKAAVPVRKERTDLKLEALMAPLDKPIRKTLKRRERKQKLKMEKKAVSSDEDELRERIPFGEQALAPPVLKAPKATLKMPKSLTHAGRTSLL